MQTTEMIQVSGIRCERCVERLGQALQDVPGLELANANLVGQLMLVFDDDETSLPTLTSKLAQAGFHQVGHA